MFSTVIENCTAPHHPHSTASTFHPEEDTLHPQEDTIQPNPTLAFIQKYTAKVDSLDLSGPSTAWYAPSAIFHNADATEYRSSAAIWTWMQQLFAPFARLHHIVQATHLIPHVPNALGADCDLVILEAETSFWLRAPLDSHEPIVAPRLLMFLVGPEELEGQGTGGRQIFDAKAYWDSGILTHEVQRRRAAVGAKS